MLKPSRRDVVQFGYQAIALSGLMGLASGCQQKCKDGTAWCREVEGGRYLALEPSDSARSDPMHLLVFFHGYGSSAEKYADKNWLTNEAAERGYLLVLPDGLDQTWAHHGSPSDARDELAFIDAVMDDLDKEWNLSETRVVGGFSQGASMAWDLACYRGDQFSAFIPASGAFWEPLPSTCEDAVNLRHTHGTEDETVPMQGRPIGQYQQGDVDQGIDVWRAVNGCPQQPDETILVGDASCAVWSTCDSGHQLQLCLHDGGHEMPSGFLPHALEWAAPTQSDE